MNFLIVGPGAMGCLFASRLKKAGHDVTLLDYRRARAGAEIKEEKKSGQDTYKKYTFFNERSLRTPLAKDDQKSSHNCINYEKMNL